MLNDEGDREMNRIEQIAIEHDCARLVYGYCQLIDVFDYDAFMQLWAEDAVWETRAGTVKGHAEIRKYLDARPRNVVGRHQCSNVIVDVIDAQRARGRCYFTYYVGAPGAGGAAAVLGGPSVVGEYLDEFRLTPNGWRFAKRGTAMTMAAPAR
jgi:hypothetical protein